MKETTIFERRWFAVPTAAQYIGSTVRAIRSLIWDGSLPRVKIGKRFVLDKADLDALMEGRKVFEIDPNRPANRGKKGRTV